MAQTIGTAASAVKTAGANVNSTIVADSAQLLIWANQAEDELCDICRYDVIANYGSLTTNGKKILDKIVEAKIAQYIILYQPEAIGLQGAALRFNMLQQFISNAVSNVEDGKIKNYLTIPS